MEENHSYSEVIGSSSMPYLNSLASQYGQIVTNDDAFTGPVGVDNIVRDLLAAGKTWKSYAESIPSAGYTGGDSYPYAKRHNILSYFTDVTTSSTQVKNLAPFSQFSSDLANNQLPDFSFIVPDLLHDAHDPPLSVALDVADSWLQQNIAPLISSPVFQKDGLLIIVFDESDTSDLANGGHVAVVVISPQAKQGFKSTTLYQHQSTLRLILHSLQVPAYRAAASTAPEMGEFF